MTSPAEPLKCPLCCDEVFTSYDGLKYHLLSIVDNLTCPACSRRFERILELAEHLGRQCEEPEERESSTTDSPINTIMIKTEDCSVDSADGYNNSILAQALLKKGGQEECDTNVKKKKSAKVEISESNQDNGTEEMGSNENGEEFFYCSSCAVSFASIDEHLQQSHAGQEVYIENVDGETSTEDRSFIVVQNKSLDGEEEEEEEEDSDGILDNTDSNDYNTIRQEDVTDKDGRVYTRKVVQIEKFWDDSDDKPKQPPKTQKYVLENGKATKIEGDIADLDDKCILNIHQCETCHLQFCKLEQYYSHACEPKESATKEEYTCTKCDATFVSARSLNAHRKTHKTEKFTDVTGPFVCQVCSTEFPTYKSLRLHKRMHDPIKSKEIEPPVSYGLTGEKDTDKWTVREMFLCPICNKTYDKQYEEVHMISHSDEPKYDCEICNRKFYTQTNLEMHARVHSNSKKFACSYCKKGFLSYESLQEHVKHTCQSRPYECQYCGRRFMRPHEKVKHERIHTGEKPHICEICGKGFRVSYCLTLHMRTHSGTRPYQCSHCGKRFKAHSVYNHHLLTHSTVRNYKCPYCPKAFKTGVQLAGHKNSHIKPFTCTECNRPFSSLYAVRAHMETHKRENNLKYSCWLCGASYARAFALRDHIKEHHSGVSLEKPEEEIIEPGYEMVAEGVSASNTILGDGDGNNVLVVLEQDSIENVEMVEEITAVE